jgi:excinuclease ABC subunit C
MRFKFIFKDRSAKLPKNCGIYAFKNGRKILYIGKAANLRERVKNHFLNPGYRDYLFLDKIEKIGYIKTKSEIEALILEANLIKKYQPKYNVIWRDDKNYFFVGITKEDFPRIFITHQPLRELRRTKDEVKKKSQTSYVGPFVDGKALKQTLKVLRKIFPYRSCYKIPNRPCLWYHLNRCPAPCFLKSKFIKEIGAREAGGRRAGWSPLDSLKIKKISQQNAKNLIKILKKGKNPVLKDLKREMKILAKNRNFEEAAKIRDKIEALERIIENAKIFEVKAEFKEWPEIEEKLKGILKTKKKISKIEAYDVSNIQGKIATGSMVTFINGKPDKNFYRRFKITGKFTPYRTEGSGAGPNDIAMLKEVLSRRFNHPEWPYPDLILIDGGRAQLNAALEVLNQHKSAKSASISVLALAKSKNELFIEWQKNPILLKNLPREIFNLILQLRDEAHRFAISYHKKLREKDLFGSC